MSNFNLKGRIVGGSVSKPQTEGYQGKVLDKPKFLVMLAVLKNDPGLAAVVAHIKEVGVAGYAATPGQSDRDDFTWKYIDGDSTKLTKTGKPAPCTKNGYPGHTVFIFETTWAFHVFGPDLSIINASSVSGGDFVEICGDCVCGDNLDNPGVFLNLKAVKFLEKGEPIGGGMTADDAFGGSPPAAPPVAPAPPATDLVDAVAPPVPVAPPAGPVVTEKGKAAGCDPAAWMASDPAWTLDVMRAQGYIE